MTSAALSSSAAAATSSSCLICAALTAPSVAEMREQMFTARSNGADIVELRVDHILGFRGREDLKLLLSNRPLPAIVTYRPSWEGGQYRGEESSRLATLQAAVEEGADFVDVELQVASAFIKDRILPLRQQQQQLSSASVPLSSSSSPSLQQSPVTKVIVSNHNYSLTPSEEQLADLIVQIQSTGADVIKFATTATDISDNAKIFRLLTRVQVPLIALVMGPKGLISRLLAPKFGAFLTFGSLGAGLESAPGQPTVAELAGVYRLGKVGRQTKVFGLIGNPVAQSKGPVLHNAVMSEAGVDAVYVPFLVDDFNAFLKTFDAPDFGGFSVTIPHKLAALEACDIVDDVAKSIGAVNTILRLPNGSLKGFNTDCQGAIEAIERGVEEREGSSPPAAASPLAGRVVVVVGAGGAGRALAFGAKAKGARVVVANRNEKRGSGLAAEVGGLFLPMDDLASEGKLREAIAEAGRRGRDGGGAGGGGGGMGAEREDLQGKGGAILANSTAVGMFPKEDETPVPEASLHCFALVFDAVYNPMETRLLREAKQQGASVVSGVEMFVGQAALQFELFMNLPAPRARMRQIVMDSLSTK